MVDLGYRNVFFPIYYCAISEHVEKQRERGMFCVKEEDIGGRSEISQTLTNGHTTLSFSIFSTSISSFNF